MSRFEPISLEEAFASRDEWRSLLLEMPHSAMHWREEWLPLVNTTDTGQVFLEGRDDGSARVVWVDPEAGFEEGDVETVDSLETLVQWWLASLREKTMWFDPAVPGWHDDPDLLAELHPERKFSSYV